MFDNIKKFLAIKAVRWAATLVAGVVAGFLGSHTAVAGWINSACAAISDPVKLSGFLATAATAGVTLYFSLKDVVTVNAKLTTAAVTQSLPAANDPGVRAATVAAVKAGEIPAPGSAAPSVDIADIIAARMDRARGGA